MLRGWTKRESRKGLCAAGAHDDAVNQVGEDVDHDDNGVRVSNEALRATIRKSREVLAMHRDLLDQVPFPRFVSRIKCISPYISPLKNITIHFLKNIVTRHFCLKL